MKLNRILLISPPYDRFKGKAYALFPIGLGYLATMLEKQGYFVRIYNADFGKEEMASFIKRNHLNWVESQDNFIREMKEKNSYIWNEVRSVIKTFNPDMVGFYTTTVTLPVIIELLKITKEIMPQCLTVLGGPHVTLMPEQTLKLSQVDYILAGEADRTIVDFCNAINKGESVGNIPGLGYKVNNEMILNKNRDFIDDIDSIPFINRDIIMFKELYPKGALYGGMLGSRGCPFRCTFCASTKIWGNRVRFRSVKNIMAELKCLDENYGEDSFYFFDDTFSSDKKRVHELCDALIEGKHHMRWSCYSRVDRVDMELLNKLKKANCTAIDIGIESGSDRVLKMMNKKITVDMVRKAVKLIRKSGISLHTFAMVGLPYETEIDIRKTIALLKEIKPDKTNMSTFLPYPGTEAYEEVVKQGMLSGDFDWSTNFKYSHHSFYNYFTPNIPRNVHLTLVRDAVMAAKSINDMTLSKRFRGHWNKRKYYFQNPRIVLKYICEKIRCKA